MHLLPPHPCPQRSAEALCDRHLKQQLAGVAAEFSTYALRTGLASVPQGQLEQHAREFGTQDFTSLYGFYKPTEVHEPVAEWLRDDEDHMQWMWAYGLALMSESTRRYPDASALQRVAMLVKRFGRLARSRGFLPGTELSGRRLSFPRAYVLPMGLSFHADVQHYLSSRHDAWEAKPKLMWCRPIGWTHAAPPDWA